jgi:hypothetical protein
VSDDVRAVGGSVECNGSIGKNVTAAGGNIRLSRESQVEGGVLAAGGEIRIGGHVREQVLITGGEAHIEGEVGGNVSFAGGGITTLPGSHIAGNLRTTLENSDRAQVAPGTVDGSVEIITEKRESQRTILGFTTFHFWFKIVWAFSLLLTAVVLILLCPRSVEETGRAIWEHPWWSLLWGFVGIAATPLIVLILCITVVGIPMGAMLLVLYFWFLYLSQIALGIVIGQRMFTPTGTGSLMLAVLVGVVLIQVLTFVPYLGALVSIAGALFGIGGILEITRGRMMPRVKLSPPIA